MFWCTECSFWQTLTITNDTKLDCTSYRLVQYLRWFNSHPTWWWALWHPHWSISVLHQTPTNEKLSNYVKKRPQNIETKENEWLVGGLEWEVFWARGKKKATPAFCLVAPLAAQRLRHQEAPQENQLWLAADKTAPGSVKFQVSKGQCYFKGNVIG